ncbi:PREDICTED: serine/threonine-protein kinase RIO3-like [Polistes canadensis]|uniref:serine/threonine-protein kinase RIO3-like n=1 Tax=Polistes canadensis TaxID=91411 RepID=UPI0007190578|nr:PREDICTED: serine/threonine-protein kinase RIO3-like [Polistes canadensis]KAI4489880.1 hypothetical protein M0804_004062 [Polistes exclamans]
MTSPWRKIQSVEGPLSLSEITSDQLAESLQKREFEKCKDSLKKEQITKIYDTYEPSDTDNDAVIAQLLQAQYNQEYDTMLKRTETKVNRDSKVNISYSNYRMSSFEEPDERKTDTDNTNEDFDRFVSIEKEYASIPRCGYKKVGEGSQIVTKHDMLMSSRINACRVFKFPPGIETGDTAGFDVKLNNKVFNSLRAHSHAQWSKEKAKTRPHTK